MAPTLFYTAIQVKDMEEALHFFCDICGLEKVGPDSDSLPPEVQRSLQTKYLPHLFGLEEKDVRFKAQLIAPRGDQSALYLLFEWITPKWTEIEKYEPSNHAGIFRSNVVVQNFQKMMERCEAYEGCEFVAEEGSAWMVVAFDNKTPHTFNRMRLVRHKNSGVVLQMKGEDFNTYLDESEPRIVKIRHRAEHCTNFWDMDDYFMNVLESGYLSGVPSSFLTHPTMSETNKYMLTRYQLARLFGYDTVKYPICDGIAMYYDVRGLDGKPQNMDVFEWYTPRTCGKPYPTTTHIGFQRLCFWVDDFDSVISRAEKNEKVKIIGSPIDVGEFTIPGTDKKIKRAVSWFDPNGVFHLIVGE